MPTVAQPLRKIFFKAKKKWIADIWKFAKNKMASVGSSGSGCVTIGILRL
jgi:hypothetical protein